MKYNEFKEAVVAAAKTAGLEEYELFYKQTESVGAEALMHEINSFSTDNNAGACFRCIYSGKMGYASTELLTAEEAQRIVSVAMDNATVIESTDPVFIHPAGDTYEKIDPIDTTEPAAAEIIDTVMSLQESVYKQDSRVIDGTQSFGNFDRSAVSLCNSKGLDLSYSTAYCTFGCVAVVKDGADMYNDFDMKTCDFTNFDFDSLASQVTKSAIEQIGNNLVDSGSYDIVFSGKMVSALLATYCSVFSAENAQQGLSLLGGKENEVIASELVTLIDDPFCRDTFLRMPFDSEGVATRRKNVVDQGRLTTLFHNLTTAHKAGVASTGNGRKATYSSPVSIMPYNFYMEKGTAGSKEDIFRTVQSGIYVTSLEGLHAGANPVTGDFSIASEGFLIENGAKSHPVKHFTISGNFYDLLKNVSLVGDDLEFTTPRGGCCFGAPTIMVKNISVAGK